jgi:superfamily II DNA or RNA helicase
MKYTYKTEPWGHQLKALKYLYKRDTAALYTDMGTGKTKVLIDLMMNRKFNRVLVVATKKACDVWEEQISIHGDDSIFSVINLVGLSNVKKLKVLKSIPKLRTTD